MSAPPTPGSGPKGEEQKPNDELGRGRWHGGNQSWAGKRRKRGDRGGVSSPRGTNQMPDERPIIMGAIGAEADERDPGQTNRFGSLGGAKLKWLKFELPIPQTSDHVGCHREPGDSQKSRELTGSHLKCRPQHIRDSVGSHQVPGQGR